MSHRTMANIKPTIDQLQAVSGGGVIAKLGDIKAVYRQQTPGNSKAPHHCSPYCLKQSNMKGGYRRRSSFAIVYGNNG